MNDKEKSLLTATEIGRLFRIPLNTVYQLSKQGKIKGIKIGRQWRYSKADIEEYLSYGVFSRTLPARRNSDFTERREYPRINCNFRCRYIVKIPSIKKFYSVEGSIRNISGGGVFLCDMPENLAHISIGDPIELEFKFEGENTGSINTQGRVVRKSEKGVSVDGFGIKFRNIDKNHQNEIIRFVD